MNKSELEENLIRVQDWIKSADEKISIWLAFQGVFITLMAPYLFAQTFFVRLLTFCLPQILILVSGLVFIGYGIFNAVSALVPRLKNSTGKKSLIYFGDISSLNLEEFKKELKLYSQSDYEEDLKKQIYISSKISSKKHKLFRDSIISFFIGILILALLFLMMILGRISYGT